MFDHLHDEHSTSAKERRAIIEEYTRFELLEPSKVQAPPPLGRPIQALGKPVEALLCEEEACGFISINHSVMRKHCNKTHGWKRKKEDPEHWSKVKAQTFFTSGGFRWYFIVHVGENQSASSLRVGEHEEQEMAAIKNEWAEVW